MISGINNIEQSTFQPEIAQRQTSVANAAEPLNSFADEDQAIISSQANMLNELDKFNSGAGNDVNLAVSEVVAKTTVSTEVNVINTKTKMMDDILDIGK